MLAALMLSAVCSMSRAAVVPPRSLFQPAMYYGKDHRRDLYEIQDARLLDIADSAVAVFDAAEDTDFALNRNAALVSVFDNLLGHGDVLFKGGRGLAVRLE